MSTTNDEHGAVTRAVRDRYTRAAESATEDVADGGCCDGSCCGATASTASELSRSVGYTDVELATLPEGADLGLGCGNPTAIAALSAGEVVLDLGSGAGIDCFLASRRVGPSGRVIGVDMTPAMLERARANADRGGFRNVEFRLGEIEALPVADGSVDVVLSNCVLNLVPDKKRALSEVYRVLRPGGRIAISDMVSDLEAPEVLSGDLDAVAACLPVQRDAYLREIGDAGFTDVRITRESRYPAEHLLDDAGVRRVLETHPELTAEVRRFAKGIYGAHFEGVRP